MRILMTADAVGGVWSYALDLARGLARHGVQVALATMGPRPSAEQQSDAATVAGLTLHIGDFRLEWQDDPWREVEAAGDWLLQLATDVDAALVHLNGYVHASLPWRVPVLVVAHSCVCSWWAAVHRTSPPAHWATYRSRVTAGIRAATLVVAPTRAMLTDLTREYGRPPRSRVIANGRRLPLHGPRPLKEPIIAAVGRIWDEAKGLATVAAVAPQLPWPVLVAGDTRAPDGGGWEGSGIRLVGRLTPVDVATLLRRASIFVHPARYEPFGLAPLEAALAGCPLVLGDIRSLRETWNGAARFVPPDDPAALAETIVELTERPTELATLAGAAMRRAVRLTPETMAHRYLATYAELRSRDADAAHDPRREATAA